MQKRSNDEFGLLNRTKTSPLQFEYGRKMFAWIASRGVTRNSECRSKISMDSAVWESFTSSVVGLVYHSFRSLLSIAEVE